MLSLRMLILPDVLLLAVTLHDASPVELPCPQDVQPLTSAQHLITWNLLTLFPVSFTLRDHGREQRYVERYVDFNLFHP
jgi:hypothetical protein